MITEIKIQPTQTMAATLAGFFAGYLLSEQLYNIKLDKERKKAYGVNFNRVYRMLTIENKKQVRDEIEKIKGISEDQISKLIDTVREILDDDDE